jgi:gliding motility-associated-like protein
VCYRVKISFFISALLFCAGVCQAQLCTGSLGDPIVNITFGAGSNPGPPAAAATTAYQYVSGDCPNDGSYTIRNTTNNCFSGSWHNLSADHTGDPNGYFMLVNASFQPGAFYLDTVRGLCGGSTYEFAAWVMNVLRPGACSPNPIRPNLTFRIERTDGFEFHTYNTLDIESQSTPVWQQAGFFFTTPPGVTEVVLRIYNNAPGGCGNDLALDDITFRACGPALTPFITTNNASEISFCEGGNRTVDFSCSVSAGFNNPVYQWQRKINAGNWADLNGATATSLSQNFLPNTAPGIYTYRMAVAEAGNMNSSSCRIFSPVLTVHVAANPVTTITGARVVCAESTLELTAAGGTQYQWTGPNSYSSSGDKLRLGNIQSLNAGKYYVLAANPAGCTQLDSAIVVVNPKPVAGLAFTDTVVCEGARLQLLASGGSTYQWTPAAGLSETGIAQPLASPADTIRYQVITGNDFSCTDTAIVSVNVVQAPRANAGADKALAKGNEVQLQAIASGQGITFNWSPQLYISDWQTLQPFVSPPADTVYVLTVNSSYGCGTATDTVKAYVYKDVYVPTAFTPNDDNLNDTWNIPALAAFPDFKLSVYNRYGQVVFESKQTSQPWDGRFKGQPCPSGVYVYVIQLEPNGKSLKGTVMVIR